MTALIGVGQIAVGVIAVGQFVLGYYGLAQFGFARHLWSTGTADPQAAVFFNGAFEKIGMAIRLK